jgi:hypothetical protein
MTLSIFLLWTFTGGDWVHAILRKANPEGLASSLFGEGQFFQSVFQSTSWANDFD